MVGSLSPDESSPVADLVAGRTQHEPLGAELVEALPREITRGFVPGVAVERVTAISDLPAAVATGDRREQCGGHPGPGFHGASAEIGGPNGSAGAVARRPS